MAFPATPLAATVEIALDADVTANPSTWVWTDISQYIRQADGARIVITHGRGDEDDSAAPSTCSLEVDNRDNRFIRHNPMSPYYRRLRQGTPIRVSVEAAPYPRSEESGVG